MRILWIVNTIFPYPAEQLGIDKTVFGGWLNGLAKILQEQENIKLAIATTYKGKDLKKFFDGKIEYYLIPSPQVLSYNKNINKYCDKVIKEFNPDILHIHGTEYAHGLSFLHVCDKSIKRVVSIQGLMNCISKTYLSGIDNKEIFKNITFRDIIKADNLFQQKNKFEKRTRYEKEIIKNCDYIIGRTDWDKYNSLAINNNAKYYCLPETIRSKFYENKWEMKNIERNTIYLGQGSYPIKGLHVLLEAISIIKRTYPDVKLYVSGNNIIRRDNIISILKTTGYAKYIRRLIKRLNLKQNVFFTGILDEEKVIDRLLKTHVVVVPSIVENESNSLTEAHILAMPTITAFSGGMTDRIIHKKTGFLYPFPESAMCAGYIMEYFSNDELCVEYGSLAREIAMKRNNPQENKEKVIEIYTNILGDNI